jgi:hypothetical protein
MTHRFRQKSTRRASESRFILVNDSTDMMKYMTCPESVVIPYLLDVIDFYRDVTIDFYRDGYRDVLCHDTNVHVDHW